MACRNVTKSFLFVAWAKSGCRIGAFADEIERIATVSRFPNLRNFAYFSPINSIKGRDKSIVPPNECDFPLRVWFFSFEKNINSWLCAYAHRASNIGEQDDAHIATCFRNDYHG
jgi:hypothetical protein